LKNSERTSHIPVIFLTAKIDPESEVKGLHLGAVDYITKPFSRDLLIKRIDFHILLKKQEKELLVYNRTLEAEVNRKTRTVLELQNAILKTVAELVECRDSITGGHIERTQHYLRLFVDFMLEHNVYTEELSSWDVDLFIISSQLHDVGKISIRDSILLKPGRLNDEEFEEMKKHAIFGVKIIEKIEENTPESTFLKYAKIMAGSHHEKWDGSGYPFGFEGDAIPLQGRLMAIVDVYDALTNERPYKGAFAHEKAVKIIRREIGTHFDPLLGEIFLTHEKEFIAPVRLNIIRGAASQPESDGGFYPALKMTADIVDIRSCTEGGHTQSMRRYLEIFIKALLKHERYKKEVSAWNIDLFLMSAKLHDVGKIAVNDSILSKAEELTDEEIEDVKNHVDWGVKVISQIKENVDNGRLLHHAEVLVGSHHEKWDGTGYPLGLKGRGIPLEGRIMAIVDTYEALINDRPHRGRKTHEEAVETIRNSGGTHFDPDRVENCLEYEDELEGESII
jgi:putative two-component system response regulator